MSEIEIHGEVDPRFAGLKDAFAENFRSRGEVGASCCVTLDGTVVAHLWAGVADQETGRAWDEATVSVVFSSTKGATAISE